jgi:hypothetical protein
MASEVVANGSSAAAAEPTPAQKLMEQHDHHATVEEVVDEEDVAHPPPSAAIKADTSGATLSEKAAGKQKAADPAPPVKKNTPLNTASEELFPSLGSGKTAPIVAPAWGKKPASLAPNGTNGKVASNDTSRASTPASGFGAPTPQPARGPAAVSIPGKYSDQLHFYPSELVPRNQLKKPLKDIILDINRRSKAKLDFKPGGPGGLIVFEATGPPTAVRQALQEISAEVGAKVCFFSY